MCVRCSVSSEWLVRMKHAPFLAGANPFAGSERTDRITHYGSLVVCAMCSRKFRKSTGEDTVNRNNNHSLLDIHTHTHIRVRPGLGRWWMALIRFAAPESVRNHCCLWCFELFSYSKQTIITRTLLLRIPVEGWPVFFVPILFRDLWTV